jgi:alkylhydroperoxidase family enzyme
VSGAGPRIPPRDEATWDDETRQVLEPLRALGGGRVLNIFATLAHHPLLLKRWLVFGNHVLGKSTLPERERELVILRTGYLCRSEYEWGQHVVIARRCGLGEAEIARVAEGPDAPGWSEADGALLRAADELHRDSRIGDATWEALAGRWDTRALLDLIFTVGQYHLVAMALNSLGVERDPGVPGLPD